MQNLYLIKLGKAWAALKRDGAVSTARKVATALGAMLRPIGSGDILIISGGTGDSALYRGVHVAEELAHAGFRCATTTQDNPFLAHAAADFQVFVFHRVVYTPSIQRLFAELKRLGKAVVFETDDLVYDPVFLQHMDYYQHMNALERKLYEHGVGGQILRDPYVRVATTSTTYLAEKLELEGKEVYVVKNKLSQKDVEIANAARAKSLKLKAESSAAQSESDSKTLDFKPSAFSPAIRIGYFSGTASHNRDFATIESPLLCILADYPQVQLVIAGPLVLPQSFGPYADQIQRLPFASRSQHFANIASVDINLVPLEMGNPFCESKSELKWFEAGVVGVPTVAVDNQTYQGAIVPGATGYLASTAEEWYESLKTLIESQDLRSKIGEAARVAVLEHYTTHSGGSDSYYDYLWSRVGGQ